MILVDPGVLEPPGRPYWTTPEMEPPTFATHVVATVFFGRSVSWIKDHFHEGHHLSDDGDLRPRKSATNHYVWRLYDIERFAHHLAATHLITGARLELVVHLVRTVARLYEHQV